MDVLLCVCQSVCLSVCLCSLVDNFKFVYKLMLERHYAYTHISLTVYLSEGQFLPPPFPQ